MNRAELKTKAKSMIKGNLWYLWKPPVMWGVCVFVVTFVITLIATSIGKDAGTTLSNILSIIVGIISTVIGIAYAKYVLEFVRGNKMEWKDVFKDAKEHFVLYLLVSILVGVIVCVASILLVIPGIIAGVGLAFYQEVCADNPELGVVDVVKKAWEMTKGHKMDIFVFMLSFIGWAILAGLTLGILYIWLIPYMNVTLVLAYEELKK